MVRQSAEVENNMNSVERIVYYAHSLEQEPPHRLPDRAPSAPWPAKGAVEMRDVVLKYRPELPEVLKGLTMSVGAGEKIGIVGRCVFWCSGVLGRGGRGRTNGRADNVRDGTTGLARGRARS